MEINRHGSGGTAYRMSDTCRGRWERPGRHLVGRGKDKRKSTVSEGKKIGWGNPAAGVK